jgi:hypothetical protein
VSEGIIRTKKPTKNKILIQTSKQKLKKSKKTKQAKKLTNQNNKQTNK